MRVAGQIEHRYRDRSIKHPQERENAPAPVAPLRQTTFNVIQSRSIALTPVRLQSGKNCISFNEIQ
jgi:hypothetical protein